MAQFLGAKAEHPDALLFFRMGDFYELFFDDAVKAASALDIALTKRGTHQGAEIPMCGVPVHAADNYLARLIRKGFKVAVCEQTEDVADARKRGSKSVVKRAVTRVVTPGTLTEENLLEPRAANFLAAIAFASGGAEAALAWADVSTGAFFVLSASPGRISEEAIALAPGEILVSDSELERPTVKALAHEHTALTVVPSIKADPRAAERRLKDVFGVTTLDGFADFNRADLSAMGLLIDYVTLTQAGLTPRLSPPIKVEGSGILAIDPATRSSLEIERSNSGGGRTGSLLGVIDRTVTPPGARLLADRLTRPLTDRLKIERRYDSIGYLLESVNVRKSAVETLKKAGDPARCVARLCLGRGGPRDLAALARSLTVGRSLVDVLAAESLPNELSEALGAITPNPSLIRLMGDLRAALIEEPPLSVRDGGFIASGFCEDLDAIRRLRDDARQVIAATQATYASETGIPLKIRHNGVLGYFLETTTKLGEELMRPPLNQRFVHRQSLAGVVRFTTADLLELDGKIARSGEQALAAELVHFEAFRAAILELEGPLRQFSEGLAVLDVATALAEWADQNASARPMLSDDLFFEAEGARHPVVEAARKQLGEPYTPNNCTLDGDGGRAARLNLVTGPNMAGKSTYLRQNALLIVLAQAGCFVPAASLKLGIVDRLFSRVGASDDLSRGRSTFMAEMVETAAILNRAGPRTFVILDEIGRGTATWDGLAIAWATAEHLHEVNRSRALFATHYHELTALADRLRACSLSHLRAREWNGDLVFLHEVAPGPADRSYGVQVAKLAGLPQQAVSRAREILERLETGSGPTRLPAISDLPLFAAVPQNFTGVQEGSMTEQKLKEMLAHVDADRLTPRDALDLVYTLKSAIK